MNSNEQWLDASQDSNVAGVTRLPPLRVVVRDPDMSQLLCVEAATLRAAEFLLSQAFPQVRRS